MGGAVLADVVVLAAPPFRPDRTTTLGGKKKRRRAPSATPWDDMPEEDLDPAASLVMHANRGIYGFRHEQFAGDAAFFNGYSRERCPRCGDGDIVRCGHDRKGAQRYRCNRCRRTFTPATGTIFEDHRLPVTAWADFVLQVISFESVPAMTREDRRAETTTPYWMAKLFAVLEGIQDEVVLGGKVWVDESYWPVAAEDAYVKPDGMLPRGLSRNQICVGVGCDESGRSIFIREGLGKTSRAKTLATFGSHVAPGSTLIHDMEGAHMALVDELALKSQRHNAKLLKGLPDDRNPLEPVNRMCYFMQRFLRAHPGFNRDDMQGYLDLLFVAMNPPDDKLEKVAMVLDRAMRYPKTLRFRQFYARNTSPDEFGE